MGNNENQNNNTVEPNQVTNVADLYDLANLITQVESKESGLNRDYTFANYSADVINNKFAVYVREQLKVLNKADMFVKPSESIIREWCEETGKSFDETMIQLRKEAQTTRKIILGEIQTMITQSRAMHGDILKAILDHLRQMPREQELAGMSMGDKLKEENKK